MGELKTKECVYVSLDAYEEFITYKYQNVLGESDFPNKSLHTYAEQYLNEAESSFDNEKDYNLVKEQLIKFIDYWERN